jgi:predicted dehydrogenase
LDVVANNQHAAQLDGLSEKVRHGGRVATPGEEGLRDIGIIQAIYESGRTGHPVKLA